MPKRLPEYEAKFRAWKAAWINGFVSGLAVAAIVGVSLVALSLSA